MLREFRALLQQTPLPVNQTRLLQLLALNMFAVSNTQLKGKNKTKTKTEIDPRRKTSSSQPHPRNLSKLPSECSRVLDRLFGALGKPLALERKKQEERKEKPNKYGHAKKHGLGGWTVDWWDSLGQECSPPGDGPMEGRVY